MAYLGMCTMDLVEYIHPVTRETIFGSSSCPPEGFIRLDLFDPAKPIEQVIVPRTQERLTPQEIERFVKPAQPQPDNTGLLYLLALGALALYA